jgi:UDP-N-acetylmuramoyl-tripeptide--D-alanyl-D-alanine ligase
VRGELIEHGLRLHIGGASEEVRLQVAGQHNQRNAIAAAAGAFALSIPLGTIAAGLRAFAGVAGRLRSFAGHKGATIIDDTYNANPDSMRAAIAVLAASSGKKVLVLGDMGELGSDAPAMHAEIGHEAKRAGIDVLLATGDLGQEYVRAFGPGATHAPTIDVLNTLATANLAAQTTVLVKGSRFMRMERVVAALVEPSATQDLKGH